MPACLMVSRLRLANPLLTARPLKDDVDFKNCKTFDELRSLVENYINYYSTERAQWSKNKMTPVEYRDHLLALVA